MQPRVVSFTSRSVSADEKVVLDGDQEVLSVETISDTRILLVIQRTHTGVSLRRTGEGNLVTADEFEGSW